MQDVLVVGAGIAGLAVANLLAKAGLKVTVLERHSGTNIEGAGIQLSPNASHVLSSLGVLDAMRERSTMPKAIELFDGDRQLSTFELGPAIEARYGAPYLLAARADLARALADALPAGVEPLYGIETEDVKERCDRATLVIGADGVGSQTRRRIADVKPADTAWTAWRRTSKAAAGSTTRVQLRPDEHRVSYPLPDGLNEVWVRRTGLAAPGGDWAAWPVLQIAPEAPWFNERTVLIGDAAHAMPPYAAQGGAMALEDAAVLAASIVADPQNPPAAFAAYEAARRPRVAAVAQLTQANRRIYHMSGPMRLARNLAMRAAPQRLLQRRMAWVYSWRPPTIR